MPVLLSASTAATTASAAPPSGAGGLLGAMFALLLVVGLIVGLGWLVRRMPGAMARNVGGLRIVSALPVGTKERIVVVAAGDRQLLLGVTAQQVTLIEALATPLQEAPAPTVSFASLLPKPPAAAANAPWTQALAARIAATPAMRRFGERARRWAPLARAAGDVGTTR